MDSNRGTLLRVELARQKKRLALDVDGVLAGLHDVINDEWNKANRLNQTFEQCCRGEWSYTEWNPPMSKEKFSELYDKIWAERRADIKPLVSRQQLVSLMEAYEVDLVTNRPRGRQGDLEAWLATNYPGMKFNIVIVDSPQEKLTKGYDVLIDDSSVLADAVVGDRGSSNYKLLLVQMPWARKAKYDGQQRITKVANLERAIGVALEMAGVQVATVREKVRSS